LAAHARGSARRRAAARAHARGAAAAQTNAPTSCRRISSVQKDVGADEPAPAPARDIYPGPNGGWQQERGARAARW
jgi:hypothetical protein